MQELVKRGEAQRKLENMVQWLYILEELRFSCMVSTAAFNFLTSAYILISLILFVGPSVPTSETNFFLISTIREPNSSNRSD
uniref:Uncharacterized protein n=1 Tax=Nelumbo nucifera TaxID=4432 RepID=A0A822XZW6_NELNU|nr:TPA_asm: hypothetical protein HUJ06_027225 [Nelumbo nucifera]